MPSLSDSLLAAAGKTPKLKSRRIEALLPEIQAELAKGYTLAQIAQALNDFDIKVSGKELSTYILRINKRRARPPAATSSVPVLSSAIRPNVPTQAPVTLPPDAEPGVRGSHDPRFLSDIINTSPNLDKLVRNGRKGPKP